MMNFEHCEIERIVIHKIGNKYESGTLALSDACFLPDDPDVTALLKSYFLSAFKKDAFYHFSPYEEELSNNPVYASVSRIFAESGAFYNGSLEIAEHLYEQSNNPNIKEGELYVVLFRNCHVEEGTCDAVGIFKSESRDTFLRVILQQNSYRLESESGINIRKLDKACLIFNVQETAGYKAAVLDKTNSKEALYWVQDFLGLEAACDDSYFQTSGYLNLCKEFVREVYNRENDVPVADQIDMLNRSIGFFKEADTFSEERFKEEVVQEPEIVRAFEQFKQQYEQEQELPLSDGFPVSDHAVKDEKRYFRHVLKLDKNFHVYIHGQRKYIEKGYDTARDMNYYKLYFRDEE